LRTTSSAVAIPAAPDMSAARTRDFQMRIAVLPLIDHFT
jgi:hypothetical protein